MIAVGGHFVSLDGREILRAPRTGASPNYVAASRAGGELVIDADAGENFFLALSAAPPRDDERKGMLSKK